MIRNGPNPQPRDCACSPASDATLLIPAASLRSRPALAAAAFLVVLHAGLLLVSLPDYFADNDLGFHISLARQYGEHGTYFWDHLNWAPTGRPNLQGPLLHFWVGFLGRLLGGEGDSYVLAFSMLAFLQWLAAVYTTFWIARRCGGDWSALYAVALLTGCIWSAGPFFTGVPSGWIFILTPWAIHYFLQRRYLISVLLTTAVIYVHLGGAPVAPFGIFLAAAFTRDWKGLWKVGALTAVLSLPYLVHFLLHLDWYVGRRGHVAGDWAVLTYVLAAAGLVLLLKRPRENLFLLISLAAPLAWFFQDNLRFRLQSTVIASAIAGLFLAWLFQHLRNRIAQRALPVLVLLVATLFPLTIPSLPIEFAWAAGAGFPRELDWNEARTLAKVMEEAGAGDRIVSSYYDSLSGAMAVYSPLRQEFGHWGEVRPPVNPARDISTGAKLYVLPLAPDDELLLRFQDEGRIRVLGGSARTTLAILTTPGPFDQLLPQLSGIIREEVDWLFHNAVNNRMPPLSDLFHAEKLDLFRERMTTQRNRVGRIQLAVLLLAFAAERDQPESAREIRAGARAWGSVANFIGDETAIDYLSDARFELFRRNLLFWGEGVSGWVEGSVTREELDRLTDQLFDEFFG